MTRTGPDPIALCAAAIKAVIERYSDAVANAALAQVIRDRETPPHEQGDPNKTA